MGVFLSDSDWRWVQQSVPIVCVDAVPLRRSASGEALQVGLILRDTPHQGRRWCMVGGRVMRDQTLAEALTRHLRQTLGDAVQFSIGEDPQPLYVSQYFTARRPVGVIDPRQHSVAMNYCVDVRGDVTAGGEAHDFAWFEPGRLPPREQLGFEQDRVLEICMTRAAIQIRFGG